MAKLRYERFDTDTPVAAAGRSILRTLLDTVVHEAPAVLSGGDEKATHDMRVAIRRLRSAIDSFKDCFPRKPLRRFSRQTRRLGRRLGAVRDADVHLAALRSALEGAAPEALEGIVFAVESIAAQRERDLERFRDVLSSYDAQVFKRLIRDG